jgi:hypothetical protein
MASLSDEDLLVPEPPRINFISPGLTQKLTQSSDEGEYYVVESDFAGRLNNPCPPPAPPAARNCPA